MHRRGDDPAEPEGNRASQYGCGGIPFLRDFLPQVERRELGNDGECRQEDDDAECGEEKCVEERDIRQIINVNIGEASGVGLAVGRQPSKLI